MQMITGAHVVPAVNHVASSTLPTALVPKNKYLLSAGKQKTASKRPHCQSEPASLLHGFSVRNRHSSGLFQKSLSQCWCVKENICSDRRVTFSRNEEISSTFE